MTAASAKTGAPVPAILREKIARDGSIGVDDYMSLCLSHYYATRDPFGALGDFTTAPEISQMFGEIIAVHIVAQWQNLGAPKPFRLIECGPGRGTLMSDMLRALKSAPELFDALHVHLVEISPVLREIQKKILKDYSVTWHEAFEDVPQGAFALIANEFLDALPIQQFQFFEGEWRERRIGLENDALYFIGGGDIIERSPAREAFVRQICARLQRNKGFAVLIDYGWDGPGYGDTLQAARHHAFANVLENPGECDLTSHVDFAALMNIARDEGCQCELNPQGAFLTANGILARAQALQQKNPGANIEADLRRLLDPDQMGVLFKVMEIA